MLRDLMVNEGLAVDATFKAGSAMKTGAAVVKDFATKEANFPSAATSANLCFVQKARIPTGLNCAKTQFSDYDANFIDVANGERIVLNTYTAGQTFATDQFNATNLVASAEGTFVAAGTDGKLDTAAAASVYQFIGLKTDGSHTLAKIYVCDTAGTNE